MSVRAPLAGVHTVRNLVGLELRDRSGPGCADRRIAQHAGRVLGGSSAMNAMVWVKGSNLDYDGWQLPGWAGHDVAPVFARIEQGPMRIGRIALSRRTIHAVRRRGACGGCRRRR